MADKLTANERYTLKPLENDGKRMYKLEIDEFIADNEMTNLFLIALAELQKNSLRFWLDGHDEKKPDWLTYYSLAGLLLWPLLPPILIHAGIHGYPRDEWNDYPNNFVIGYCHHSEDTFPTWHRPYMYLFEMIPLNL